MQLTVGIEVEVVVVEVEVVEVEVVVDEMVVVDEELVDDDVVVELGGRRRAGCSVKREFAATVCGSRTSIALQRARRPTTSPQEWRVRARASVSPVGRVAPALGASVRTHPNATATAPAPAATRRRRELPTMTAPRAPAPPAPHLLPCPSPKPDK